MLPPDHLIAQEITGYQIFPENPTSSDEISLVVQTSFSFMDCRLDSLHEYYACGAFAFDGFYGTGFVSGDCSRSDTISIGTLPNGPYQISYRMYYLGWAQVDQIDTFITVGTTGIDHRFDEASVGLKITPNPSRGQVNIVVDNGPVDRLRIYSIAGITVFDSQIRKDGLNDNLDVSLTPGMYICVCFNGEIPLLRRKFIILN